MRKYGFKAALWVLTLGVLTACSEDENASQGPLTFEADAYILNSGDWGANNASIQGYNRSTGEGSGDLFALNNGRGIGDAQDLCIYGSKIYVTSSTSAKVEIVNRKDFKVVKTLPLKDDAGRSVEARYLTATGGMVYFTSYDGMLSRLDTLSMTVTGRVAVGDHPEALTHANGKLYVNISGFGMGNEIAVVDIASFTKIKALKVKLNPNTVCITAADGNVYSVSDGNFAGMPNLPQEDWIYQTVQRIDPKTDGVTEVCNGTFLANKGNKMYILYAEYNLPDTHSISEYDLTTGISKPFISISSVPKPSFIDVDPLTGDVYISNTVIGANHEIYLFNAQGVFKKKIETGYYTTGLFFVPTE